MNKAILITLLLTLFLTGRSQTHPEEVEHVLKDTMWADTMSNSYSGAEVLARAIAEDPNDKSVQIAGDTIPTWTIHINDSLIADFPIGSSEHHLTLNSSQILKNDSIRIQYFSDTPCQECYRAYIVRDSITHTKFKTVHPEPMSSGSFSLVALLEINYQFLKGSSPLEIIYVQTRYMDMKGDYSKLVRIHFQ